MKPLCHIPNDRETLTIKIGDRFGRLTVMTEVDRDRWSQRRYVCRCNCGALTRPIRASELKSGNTRSCGCLNRDSHLKHGVARTPTYKSYNSMIQRCTNPNADNWNEYGGGFPFGVGVSFPDEWHPDHSDAFAKFLAFHGERPAGTTLGRYLDTGSYGWILVNGKRVQNSCWMTDAEQKAERAGKVAMRAWHERRALDYCLLWRWRKKSLRNPS